MAEPCKIPNKYPPKPCPCPEIPGPPGPTGPQGPMGPAGPPGVSPVPAFGHFYIQGPGLFPGFLSSVEFVGQNLMGMSLQTSLDSGHYFRVDTAGLYKVDYVIGYAHNDVPLNGVPFNDFALAINQEGSSGLATPYPGTLLSNRNVNTPGDDELVMGGTAIVAIPNAMGTIQIRNVTGPNPILVTSAQGLESISVAVSVTIIRVGDIILT